MIRVTPKDPTNPEHAEAAASMEKWWNAPGTEEIIKEMVREAFRKALHSSLGIDADVTDEPIIVEAQP